MQVQKPIGLASLEASAFGELRRHESPGWTFGFYSGQHRNFSVLAGSLYSCLIFLLERLILLHARAMLEFFSKPWLLVC